MRVGIVKSLVPSCDLYRASGPAQILADRGEIELVPLPAEFKVRYAMREHGPDGPPQPTRVTGIPEGLDVIVFIRGVLPERMVQLIPLFQRMGIAVVVDVDDDYERLPTMLLDLYKIQPGQNPSYNWRHVKKACQLADLVTCSTEPLKRYAPHGRVVVLKNQIPRSYLRIGREAERDGRTIGWGGTVYGHPGDLRMARAGVADVVRDMALRFYAIGDGVMVQEDLGLDDAPLVSGIVPLEQYPYELAKLDVAIAPLVLDFYRERAKSWLKMLESLALGSVIVASEGREYIKLFDELAVWCAANDSPVPAAVIPSRGRDWYREIARPFRCPADEALELSAAASRFIEERHLLEDHADSWGEAWAQAIHNRRYAGKERRVPYGRQRV